MGARLQRGQGSGFAGGERYERPNRPTSPVSGATTRRCNGFVRGARCRSDSFLRVAENARYFAMLSTASADALIACWDAKYAYNAWRPVTAIRAGESDGNPYTAPDPSWIGLIATPNHPEYPAAHGCFSGAVTETLKSFFGSDEVCASRWTATSPASSLPFEAHARFLRRAAGGQGRRGSTGGCITGPPRGLARYWASKWPGTRRSTSSGRRERARRSRTTLIQETRC